MLVDDDEQGEASSGLSDDRATGGPQGKGKGRKSGLWGYVPPHTARTCVAVDCLTQVVARHGANRAFDFVTRLRGDPRVACVVLLLAGRGASDPDALKTAHAPPAGRACIVHCSG